ncbi:tissue inhibitor of metalloproteinase domain-containing protein [Ditylenchus destructor]|nr:tissue inhibitor of metalloproteinase domain-containing protein [Ditylenchus destructor]
MQILVAHTRIDSCEASSNFSVGEQLHYKVTHIEVFKLPSELNTTDLPKDIYSAENEGLCGINLEPGHEYLLAGNFYRDGTLGTSLCGQIVIPDVKRNNSAIFEWREVPKSLQDQLQMNAFEHKCHNLTYNPL